MFGASGKKLLPCDLIKHLQDDGLVYVIQYVAEVQVLDQSSPQHLTSLILSLVLLGFLEMDGIYAANQLNAC